MAELDQQWLDKRVIIKAFTKQERVRWTGLGWLPSEMCSGMTFMWQKKALTLSGDAWFLFVAGWERQTVTHDRSSSQVSLKQRKWLPSCTWSTMDMLPPYLPMCEGAATAKHTVCVKSPPWSSNRQQCGCEMHGKWPIAVCYIKSW